MPSQGDEVILIREDLGVEGTAPTSGEDGVLLTETLGRGSSGSGAVEDEVMLLTPNIAIKGGAITATGDFDITITGTNSPIAETETLFVDADVTNNLGSEQSGTIVLFLDGDPKDSIEVTIPANGTESHTFRWETANGDAGDYTATVESGTDADTASITVTDISFTPTGDFGITINATNSPVIQGVTMWFDVTVTNNSSSQQQGNIVLFLDGAGEDAVNVDIPGNGTRDITLAWPTVKGDAGTYTASVESGTDADSTSVEVLDETIPEDELFTVDSDDAVSQSDREGGVVKRATVASVSGIRYVEASIDFTQEGTYYSNDAGMGIDIEDPQDTGGIRQQPFYVLAAPEKNFSMTGVFDLESVQTGDLVIVVDDGDGSITKA